MAGDGAEKSEKPTERRRRDARKKGTVARSVDLPAAAACLVLVLILPKIFGDGAGGAFAGFRQAAATADVTLTEGSILRTAAAIALPLASPFFLLATAVLGTGIVVNLGQVGLHVSATAVVPKFQRIDPMQGAKRLFGKQGLFECLKATAKALLFSALALSAITSRWSELLMLPSLGVASGMSLVGSVAHGLLLRIGGTWFVIACVDYIFQRRQIEKSLMMTKDEVRQEMKEQEASPEMKSHRNTLRRKMSKRRVAQAMKEADVVVTNPTHYSVAIRYQAGQSHAPVVVAKGVDFMAFRIRELALENRVPIVPNPPLARALYRDCEVGDFVPRDLFGPVAEILAYVYRTLGRIPK
ncbi:MAG: hypothetical protein C4320_00585 [Armatimonadota bacterium]